MDEKYFILKTPTHLKSFKFVPFFSNIILIQVASLIFFFQLSLRINKIYFIIFSKLYDNTQIYILYIIYTYAPPCTSNVEFTISHYFIQGKQQIDYYSCIHIYNNHTPYLYQKNNHLIASDSLVKINFNKLKFQISAFKIFMSD